MKHIIEDKVSQLRWLIVDLLDENGVIERTPEMIINDEFLLDSSWEWTYSVYKNHKSGVIDGIKIRTKSISKLNNILSELKLDKNRIESVLGYKINIVKINWKSFSNKVDDFKSFVKFITKRN
jgi:hypothetical protein